MYIHTKSVCTICDATIHVHPHQVSVHYVWYNYTCTSTPSQCALCVVQLYMYIHTRSVCTMCDTTIHVHPHHICMHYVWYNYTCTSISSLCLPCVIHLCMYIHTESVCTMFDTTIHVHPHQVSVHYVWYNYTCTSTPSQCALCSRFCYLETFPILHIGDECVIVINIACNLCFTFGSRMSFVQQVNSTVKFSFGEVRKLSMIKKKITPEAAETLTHAF